MFKAKLENKKGDFIECMDNSPFTIVEADGLYPEAATINTSQIALIDGTKFNSSKVNEKMIMLRIEIGHEAEENRIKLYKVLKPKEYIKFYYESKHRKVYIEGIVESMPIDHFSMKQACTLTFKCPFPYFKEAQEIINDINNTISLFKFPFAITENEKIPLSVIDTQATVTVENIGDINIGMRIEIYARNEVKNPKIFNYVTGQFIGVNITMQTGDVIIIDTNKGKKTINLLREGETINIFNNRIRGMSWLELIYGENTFYYEADEGIHNMNVTLYHQDLYTGV